MQKLPQQIQDDLFRKMSADEKLAVGASLWKLGKESAKDKVVYSIAKLTPAQIRDLIQARKEYQRGEYVSLRELESELGDRKASRT